MPRRAVTRAERWRQAMGDLVLPARPQTSGLRNMSNTYRAEDVHSLLRAIDRLEMRQWSSHDPCLVCRCAGYHEPDCSLADVIDAARAVQANEETGEIEALFEWMVADIVRSLLKRERTMMATDVIADIEKRLQILREEDSRLKPEPDEILCKHCGRRNVITHHCHDVHTHRASAVTGGEDDGE